MIVPLCLGERVLGAISFIGAESGRVYSETDLEMAKELGLRSALALENARLYRKSEKLAEDLQNAVSARDEFISICSHELKTPITSMKLQFELAARKLMDDDKSVFTTESYQKQIDTTNRQLDRMTRLIDEMLDISRINTGKLTMEENTISLNELLEETLSRFIDQFESKKISVTLDLGTDECIVKGDKFRLDQVFSNILTNAMKYGAAKPVKISMHQTQDAIRVEFADQGIGIQPQDLTRVFNRFERVSSAGNITGLGLGLFISQQIVQAHGGMIWAEINAAKGSTFVVELPQLKKSITGL